MIEIFYSTAPFSLPIRVYVAGYPVKEILLNRPEVVLASLNNTIYL
jgi:hypothetical protein